MPDLPIRLTQTVKKGGCAAKVAALELRHILANVNFPAVVDGLMIDGRDFDDAAVYRISDQVALVQTLDFFTPILDSPYDFGRVAAANALSDIYAMGGRPKTALAILAFSVADMPASVVSQVMQGACDVLALAKASLAGGHSIDDDTLKFGLSVSGTVHPAKIWANTGARPGDRLLLTKPLGTGAVTAALKREAVKEEDIRDTIESMALLNNAVDLLDDASLTEHVHAATDVTGFGLSGHAQQMAKASGVRFNIAAELLPTLPRAREFLEAGYITKAHRTNREYTNVSLEVDAGDVDQLLFHDPQTSGGLLLSVSPEAAEQILATLRIRFPACALIGEVLEGPPATVKFARNIGGHEFGSGLTDKK